MRANDMRLKLEGIPSDLQSRLNVRDNEEVVFVRLNYGYERYTDGTRFANGKEISLQLLGAGVTVTLVHAEEKTKAIHESDNVLELMA
jgi:hypothetical protein